MTDTLDFFGKEVRSKGFTNVTGLPTPSNCRMRHVAFPRHFWGKFTHDGENIIIVILNNGQVWIKYSHSVEKEDIDWLYQQMGDNTFQILELVREPYLFDGCAFISNLPVDIFAVRVADPDHDFAGACNPDASYYLSKFVN